MSNPTTYQQEFVYVIHAEGTNFIKIGYSTNPQSRMSSLQTASPHSLRLLGFWPGSRIIERRVHKYLSQFRQCGEWFSVPPFCCLKIWEIIKGHRSKMPSHRQIPKSPKRAIKSITGKNNTRFNLKALLPRLKTRSYWEVYYRRDTVKFILRWHNKGKDFKCITFPSFTIAEFDAFIDKRPEKQKAELVARILSHLDSIERREEVIERSIV